MSSYGYGPPPPPPPQSTVSGSADAYGRGSGLQRRGGSHSRGRGGQGHHAGPRHDHHPPQPRYDYSPPSYPARHPSTAPNFVPVPSPGGYPHQTSQWNADHGHHPHASMLPASYHPVYPPQSYPPAHYSPAQQAPYAPPQHYTYGAPPPPNPSQWNGPAQQPHHVGGQSRGGYHDRGPRGPPTGRFDRNRPSGGGYTQYHSPPDRRSQAQHHPYAAPPAPHSGSGSHHKEPQHGQQSRRPRGGHKDGGNRGRGGHHGDKRQHNKSSHNAHQQPKTGSASTGKKKKRKTNTLGLTPGNESESDDDEGEEQTLRELLGEDALKTGDVAAFLAERRKNFPTKARTAAKKAAAHAQKQTAHLEKEADKLRRQLRKVESSIKRKREQGDEGDEMRGTSDDVSDNAPPESLSSKPTSAAIPSRPALTTPGKRADVTRHCKYYSTGGTCGKRGKCRFVHDADIREAAIKDREANNGRLTIQQRLLLNDKEQEDLTLLRSIQYLRQKGIMSDAEAASAASCNGNKQDANRDSTEVKNSATMEQDAGPPLVVSSSSAYRTLPPASASLPPPPPKELSPAARQNVYHSKVAADNGNGQGTGTKHYEGWLLRPYGSSVKENYAAP